ncbi:MAG: TIGR04076 family protein [Oscillospiraceae bacterium]|nr:TIGR04076 family protein [Oscillospiraceae bacterium]
MAKCKITVLKCLFDTELKETYIHDSSYGPCPYFQPGQVFWTDGKRQPEGFQCKIGWKSIRDEAAGMCSEHPFFTEQVVCCNDGVRPVVFLIESVSE